MLENISVSPSPHISKSHSTRSIMLDVIIGLVPAMAMACWFFRGRAAIVIGVCVVSCVLTEWVCNLIREKKNSIDDLSAALTGVILALSLPPAVADHWWLAVIGSVFAIAIGKMVFGGLGSNTFNPAMAARAFLTASFGAIMTTWAVPATYVVPLTDSVVISAANSDAISQATPLAWSKEAIKGKADVAVTNDMFAATMIGEVGGCLGETSAIAMVIGVVYLLIRKTIAIHIPLAVLISAFVFAYIGWLANPERYVRPWLHLTGGGMLFCAFFIATDPVTAPLTTKGMWMFGIGVGALIMLIRMVGEYPEGIMYAILIMNALTPMLDRFCKLVPAGGKDNE
ncbi:MAG: RnfABCDGE type electron transport complex subunit D [Planctomycetes bacterium]|nr:RnfABCDGE type electron transport complex subunit D [Planctomycetota bacterium]